MRIHVAAVFVILAGAVLLPGCMSSGGENVESVPSGPVQFNIAYDRAVAALEDEEVPGAHLLAAFAVESYDPLRLNPGRSASEGFVEFVKGTLHTDPGDLDGSAPGWGFLFQVEDDPDLLAVSVLTAAPQGNDTLETTAERPIVGVTKVQASMARLLHVNGPVQPPSVDSSEAVAIARTNDEFVLAAQNDSYVLTVLAADENGNAQWRVITASYPAVDGHLVRIDGTTGEMIGDVEEWPIADIAGGGAYNGSDVFMPGDKLELKWQVPPGPWWEVRLFFRQDSGVDPSVHVTPPSGNSMELTPRVVYRLEPEVGAWTLEAEWTVPSPPSSHTMMYRVAPFPHLFADE